MMGNAFRQPPRVDENQRGAPRADQIGEPIVDLVPHLVAGDRAQLALRDLDKQIHLAPMADRDDARIVAQELRHGLDGLDGSREADPLQPASGQPVEPSQAQREVRASLVIGDGVNLVDNDGSRRLAASRGSSRQ